MAMGRSNKWKPGSSIFHADDHCVGQAYVELYFLKSDPAMIAPLREPARPGKISYQGNQRVRFLHLCVGLGRESRAARPRAV